MHYNFYYQPFNYVAAKWDVSIRWTELLQDTSIYSVALILLTLDHTHDHITRTLTPIVVVPQWNYYVPINKLVSLALTNSIESHR